MLRNGRKVPMLDRIPLAEADVKVGNSITYTRVPKKQDFIEEISTRKSTDAQQTN